MIIKGQARGDGRQLASYLLTVAKNERISLVELTGVASLDLKGALLEMEAVARGSRCARPFYHAQIAPAEGEDLTPEQRRRAIDLFVERMGLADQPRAVVEHVRDGRTHLHVVVSRVDGVTLRTISDFWSFRRHEEISRALEAEFGHQHVQGAFAMRDGQERPKRARTHEEAQQAERTRIRPEDVAAELTLLWGLTDSAKAFRAAIERSGYILAQGDGARARWIVLDQAGEIHSLRRRLTGVKVEDINRRMMGLDRSAVPSVDDARAQLRARAEREREQAQPAAEDSTSGAAKRTIRDDPDASRHGRVGDVAAIFASLTERQSTFSRAELAREIDRRVGGDAANFRATLLAAETSPEIVKVGEDARNRERFTTKDMLATEQRMADAARSLARRRDHRVDAEARSRAGVFPQLNDGQRAAFDHVMKSTGLSLVEGYAGTGKSRMLGAAREAWEAQGYRVRGIAPTGIAAENLSDSAGIASGTIHSALFRWDADARLADLEAKDYAPATKARIRGEIESDRLTGRDVIVLDEAGMVGSRLMEQVLAAADKAGAKVVAAFDTLQVEAMSAGAAIRALKERHGAIEVTEVLRQKEAWQRDAALEFAFGKAEQALDRYQEAGCTKVSETREDAKLRLVDAWAADRTAQPQDRALILAYTNADVRDLNALARAVVREKGELGPDHELIGRNGPEPFAVGDRFYFLRNDRGLDVRNGSLGTIANIEGNDLTVTLDGSRSVKFDQRSYSDFAHGYAATVIKSQGATVDRTYVLASEYLDRRSAYVAMSRHRQQANLFWAREEFGDEGGLARILSRERSKDTTLDYLGREDAAEERDDDPTQSPEELRTPGFRSRADPGEDSTDPATAEARTGDGARDDEEQRRPSDGAESLWWGFLERDMDHDRDDGFDR